MLCNLCQSIVLDFTNNEVSQQIRSHANLDALAQLKDACDFCSLVYEHVKKLDEPSIGRYCKQSWGMDFYRELRRQSPVTVVHRSWQREHNIIVACLLDAEHTDGYPGGPRAFNWREMLGGVYVEPDNRASQFVSGRPLAVGSTKSDIMQLARRKYDECQTNHITCNASRNSSFVPTRLLDLSGFGQAEPSVCVMTVPSSFDKPYAALSYCWGKALNLRLTTNNLHSFTTEGMSCNELPATIQDACELCHELGISYIWVCSLCIIQDSERDWLEQSSMMADVYNGSEITISAAGSDGCNTGLYHRRALEAQSIARLAWRGPNTTTGTCFVRSKMAYHGYMEPADSRGWTLQETLLSRRLLVLGSIQLSWQCATSIWNESGTSLRPAEHMAKEFPCPSLHYPISPYDDGRANLRSDPRSDVAVWGELVRSYCHRRLTLPKDKLPAISGLAKWMSRGTHRGDKYFAGLWWSHMPRSLLWYNQLMFPADLKDATRPATYRAPSWSWASIDSEYFDWLDTAAEVVRARVLECKLVYKGNSIFGEVQNGYLTIEAPTKMGWLVPNQSYPESFDFWGDDWETKMRPDQGVEPESALGRVRMDVYTEEDIKRAGLQHHPDNVRQCECLRITSNFGILVEECASRMAENHDAAGLWRRRLGIVQFNHSKSNGWWGDAAKELINFV